MDPVEKESSYYKQYGRSVGAPNKICKFSLGSTTKNTWNKSELWITMNISCRSRSYCQYKTHHIRIFIRCSDIPMCPMQLLTTKSRVVMQPPRYFQKEDINCRKQWRHVNEFWSRWKKEVYATLQACHA